ncbi:preprotein translocase subunit SecE [Enterococcus cecorum]|uniref:Protein translocase subunit SecE n=1 Tax=Enterococcus cecorum TaxID=44008 RepID=A0AAW8TMV4_9ENTE|nr:preprotein translocase subunit SecE [Enterococcus cecorum]KLO72934.1 preprotein translocase subunit SecE [Enterococcus cecorum]MCJ0573562.1 preprotein translocase subunit SecE [Enterococcus cecorum]MCJ0576268.1 preprotein translocase subunit SecE [Enterococcus cecorum]MCJ0586669.1 preprotein translocase subunit SecE [Enterococcus cecorum]MCJ0591610.1 preprotein translocase subunit SecE [Enterococcus cecorum]
MKFIKSVIDEMKRVTWPTKQQLRKDTIVVIETSIIFTVMFFVMDTVIQKLLALILK